VSTEPSEPRVDVAELMAAIRSRLRPLPPDTGLSADELRRRAQDRVRAAAEDSDVDADLVHRLLGDGDDWNLCPDYPFVSHRTGPSRGLVRVLKSALRPLVRLYTDPLVERQAQLNLCLAAVCRRLAEDVVRLEEVCASLALRRERPVAPPGASEAGDPPA
jgi:hypothetical protein